MVKYQGIIPALKYIVITTNLYHNLQQMVSLVNIYPKNAATNTVKAVPITVLDTDINAAWPSPGILTASM